MFVSIISYSIIDISILPLAAETSQETGETVSEGVDRPDETAGQEVVR